MSKNIVNGKRVSTPTKVEVTNVVTAEFKTGDADRLLTVERACVTAANALRKLGRVAEANDFAGSAEFYLSEFIKSIA